MEESGRVMVGHTGPSCQLGKNERRENKSLYLMDAMINPTPFFILKKPNQSTANTCNINWVVYIVEF